MVERSRDLHIYNVEGQRHAPVYTGVHDSCLLYASYPALPSELYLIKKRVLLSQDPMFGHDKAV
jgi:hypothetical protein